MKLESSFLPYCTVICIKDIVEVLERVDSPGAPWRQKLEKLQAEELHKLQQLELQA
jgi:hypothetical protein